MEKYIFIALIFIFNRPVSSAELVKIGCAHPVLCSLAKELFEAKDLVEKYQFKSFNLAGDPHHFSPSASELKSLYKSDFILFAPLELASWQAPLIKQTKHKKQFLAFKGLKLGIDRSHFWLYPTLNCQFRKSLKFFFNQHQISTLDSACPFSNFDEQILPLIKKWRSIYFVVSHGPIAELLNSYGLKTLSLVSDGHGHQIDSAKLKELTLIVKNSKQVFWIKEKGILKTHRVIKKWKRENDTVLELDTLDKSSLQLLLKTLQEKGPI